MTPLTRAESERVALLIEELSESIQVACKILRHGFDSFNPDDDSGLDNRELLQKELGDVKYAIRLMSVNSDIDRDMIHVAYHQTADLKRRYLHFQDLFPV